MSEVFFIQSLSWIILVYDVPLFESSFFKITSFYEIICLILDCMNNTEKKKKFILMHELVTRCFSQSKSLILYLYNPESFIAGEIWARLLGDRPLAVLF